MSELKTQRKKEPNWQAWEDAVKRITQPERSVEIAIVGKYLDIGDYQLKDSYLSVAEALKHAGVKNNTKINIHWVDAKTLEKEGTEQLKKFDGILVPGGFGSSGIEGKIKAIQFARENNKPYLGLCLGMQLAVIEFARNICGLDANSTEFNPSVKDKVIDILPEQRTITEKGATMRLGGYPAILTPGSRVSKLYNSLEAWERHRHRYEVDPDYHKILSDKGLVFSGLSPNGRLAEFIELPNHKFFIATQSHPEFKSSLLKPAPLFDGFINACLG